jgi:hypothetical protein
MGPTALLSLYFPSEGSRVTDFIALKNPSSSAGFEPATWVQWQARYHQTTEGDFIYLLFT